MTGIQWMVCWWVLVDCCPLAILRIFPSISDEYLFLGKKRENIGIEKSVICWVYVKFHPKINK
jgi:hypothetical protein